MRISGEFGGRDFGGRVLPDITGLGSSRYVETGPAGGEIQKICSNEHFLFDVSDSDRFRGRHECNVDAQDTLVLEERSGGIPWSDGPGAGGVFAGAGMV